MRLAIQRRSLAMALFGACLFLLGFGASVSAADPPAPVLQSTAVPQITGVAQAGSVLGASPGAWSETPGSVAYQWLDCAASMCAPAADQSGPQYVVEPEDVGFQIEVSVTATLGAQSAIATSAPTVAVTTLAPTLVSAPVISGTPAAAQTLSVSSGSWTGAPTAYAYAWYVCQNPVTKACLQLPDSGPSYAVDQSTVGLYIVAVVYALNAYGRSSMAMSAPAGPVASAPPAVSVAVPVAAGGTEGFTSGPVLKRVTVGRLKVTAHTVRLGLGCSAGAGDCAVATLVVSVVEHLSGHRIQALSAATHTVTIAIGSVRVPAAHRATIVAQLGKVGRALLKRFKHFQATATLSSGGVVLLRRHIAIG